MKDGFVTVSTKNSEKKNARGNGKCPSCNTAVAADARFCHACGAQLTEETASGGRDPVTLALYGLIGVGVVATIVGLVFFSGNDSPAPPQMTAPTAPAPASSPQVDLSTMSPREAADRLFNRVMMAHEQGNSQEVAQFGPMALTAYERVENPDLDAHYHVGLIHLALGDFENSRKQAALIAQSVPDHLLGLMLEQEAAEKMGDTAASEAAYAAFAKAYDNEILTGRPEYQAHRNSIEAFRVRAAAR